MGKEIICSDESVNSYGFRVLTKGIQLDRFSKNPIGLFNHFSSQYGSADYKGPIVKWSLVKKTAGNLIATPTFDLDDETGATVSKKFENGFLNAASIGFHIIETSEDPSLMLPGQKYPTVTKCELMEISIVDIPANANACALYDADGKRIELNAESITTTLSAVLTHETQKPKNKMKLTINKAWTALAANLKLVFGAGEETKEVETTPEVLSALNDGLTELAAVKTELETVKSEKTQTASELATAKEAAVTAKTEDDAALAAVNEKLTAANAEITKLKGVDEGADANGGNGKPAGEADTSTNKFETSVDKEKKLQDEKRASLKASAGLK